jgi:hypothetical protein
MAGCPACTALFEEARRGQEWLEFLSPDPEIPTGLLEKILTKTGPGKTSELGLATASGGILPISQAWQQPGFMGFVRRFAEPRLMMTAAMAFFSLALTLNLTGVRLADVKLTDMRPAAVRSYMERRLTMASTPIVRYYDHLRVVYELESRMRELRRSAGTGTQNGGEKKNNAAPSAPGESKQRPGHKDGGTRMDAPQQSITPSQMDPNGVLDAGLKFADRHTHSSGSKLASWERSTRWTA